MWNLLQLNRVHWSPSRHWAFPDPFKRAVFVALLCNARLGSPLPLEMWCCVFVHLAHCYPIESSRVQQWNLHHPDDVITAFQAHELVRKRGQLVMTTVSCAAKRTSASRQLTCVCADCARRHCDQDRAGRTRG